MENKNPKQKNVFSKEYQPKIPKKFQISTGCFY